MTYMKFPVKPMLLRRAPEVPGLLSPLRGQSVPKNWWYEPKLDGSRLLYYFDGKTVRLSTRSGREVTYLYPEIAVPLDKPTILDGELVSLDDRGVPDFQKLQPRLMKLATSPTIVYAVFDVLWHGDYQRLNLRTYELRREVLEGLELPDSFSVVPRSKALTLEGVLKAGFEGVVSKGGDSIYQPNTRSMYWFKTTPVHSTIAVVCGYTPGKGSREGMIGSLVLGLWDGDSDLRHIGAVGTGFTQESAKQALDMLQPIRTIGLLRGAPSDMVTVKPLYAVAVEFKGWTDRGKLRHPAFKGFVDEMEEATTWKQLRT